MAPGDIAFLGYNADGNDDFAIVVVSDLDGSVTPIEINFTDNEWDGSAFNSGEGLLTWTINSNIAAGTVVTFNNLTSGATVSVGSVSVTGSMNLGTTDEVLYAFEGDISNPTSFLAAFANDDNQLNLSGTGLTLGNTAIEIDGDEHIAEYTGTRGDTAANLLTTINDPSNWTTQDGSGDQSNDGTAPDLPFDSTSFVADGATTVAIAPTDAVKAEGDSGTTTFSFTVTRSDTSGAASVDYAVSSSEADASDFDGGVLPSGTVNFADGEANQTIDIVVSGDTDPELDENFTVTLSNSSTGLAITTATADGTIQDDDTGTTTFINEIHYDNISGDIGEAIEIAGIAGTDLTNGRLVLYNGSDGGAYDTISLSGTIPDLENGFGTLSFAAGGLQNGPDGIALVDDGDNVIQFLSYEGSFTATDGPAIGLTSTDIGVSESNSSTSVGSSLQLTGTGTTFEDFTWNAPADDSFGSVNSGQTFECFLTGTRVLTEKGEIVVEELKIGDQVQTAEGVLKPIKWIGRATCQPNQVKNPLRAHPILIKAGALGNNTPHRDLYVSPDHALLVEGLLINAGALVNNISILKTEPKEAFTYYHIELENHVLLVAEGTLAESYLPQKEDRMSYDNGAEYEQLYPYGSRIILWPLDYPRVSSKVTVPRYITKHLNQI